MLVRISKWGNSLALRIPAPFAQETGAHAGSGVVEYGEQVVPAFALSGQLDLEVAEACAVDHQCVARDSADKGAEVGEGAALGVLEIGQ